MNHFLNTISFQSELPEIEDYWDLFQTTGWNKNYNFTLNDLSNAIKNSWYVVSAYNKKKLIGFGRVISDGIHHALIVDLIIHPDYQKKGVGKKLLDELVQKCVKSDIRDIQLFSAKDKYLFYEKSGFERRPENAPGMQLKK